MAAAQRLTDKILKKVLAGSSLEWMSDNEGIRGYGRLVARKSGVRSMCFYFRYSLQRRMKYLPIGPYSAETTPGFFTLEQARSEARRYSSMYRNPQTRDVRQALQSSRRAQEQEHRTTTLHEAPAPAPIAPVKTVGQLCLFYAEQLACEGKASAPKVRSDIEREILTSPLASRCAATMTSEDIANVLRPVCARSERTAGKARSYLAAAYERARLARTDPKADARWQDFAIATNPVKDTVAIGKSKARDRTLDAQELGWLWLYLESCPAAAAPCCRALRLDLLLGGQRAEQLLRSTVDNFDRRANTLLLFDPKGKGKDTPRKHRLPLTEQARKEVEELIVIARSLENPYIVPGRNRNAALTSGALSHWITECCSEFIRAGLLGADNRFAYIDIRRSTQSAMMELEIDEETINFVLSHGMTGLVFKHYKHVNMTARMLKALNIWTAFLLRSADEQREEFFKAFPTFLKSAVTR